MLYGGIGVAALGLLAAFFAAGGGGGPGAPEWAPLWVAIALLGGLVALFGVIERRLVEIRDALADLRSSAPPTSPSAD